ncbi:DNA-binding SARP family transcriptional activator [Streptomyces sp. B3I7]|uniref:AfsR/SARP family transcriptional regulator n=1 Tax=Streptomyces sp. B3I7 TaxID=3042269 RepID=UPI0027857D5C|nr:BTAD domain-containing putative transcriptional regulator [Streptomyces sp. B3I7]MDQ0808903.1 DNA-binding SARP family transcriptional activator [Streptomyces sp. B3I7]
MTVQQPGIRLLLLGPLEAWDEERRIHLGGTLNERVLAVLLLEQGRVVSVSQLVQAAWAYEPPATASHQIRKAVGELRRRIPNGGALIATEPSGYRILLDEGQLDLALFAAHEDHARRSLATGDRAETARQLEAALALWRGPAMPDSGSATIDAACALLEERRLSALESLADLRLSTGEAAGLIGELRHAIAAHPYRESLRHRLLLALYQAGRQAEAINEYANTRTFLAEELGIDPSPELSALYQAILRNSPELSVVSKPAQPAGVPSGPAAPAQGIERPCPFPYVPDDFTGRTAEIDRLVQAATRTADRSPRIAVIDGMAGSGKTALAVHVVHLLAERFPDGLMYLDLKGYCRDEEEVGLSSGLEILLRSLGLPEAEIPEDMRGRLTLWRARTSALKLLVLFDHVGDPDLVHRLLPPSQDSFVLVTNRSQLMDLDGAESISLGPLSEAESTRLLSSSIGCSRAEAEPEATAELAGLCGYLPLALRIAGARIRKREHWTIRYFVDRLRNADNVLDELRIGSRSVAASLATSYEALPPRIRGHFQLLSLRPASDFDVESASTLLGIGPATAERTLEYLVDMHLLQQKGLGRYGFHPLVQAFGRSLPDDPLGRRPTNGSPVTLTRITIRPAS